MSECCRLTRGLRHFLKPDRSKLPLKSFTVEVRPKLLECESKNVQANTRGPTLAGLCPGSFAARVVKVGKARRCSRADHFRIIGSWLSVVSTRDCRATHRIENSLQKASSPKSVIAGVLP